MEDITVLIGIETSQEEEREWRGVDGVGWGWGVWHFWRKDNREFPRIQQACKNLRLRRFWAWWDRSWVPHHSLAAHLLLRSLLTAPCKCNLTACSLSWPEYFLHPAPRFFWCRGRGLPGTHSALTHAQPASAVDIPGAAFVWWGWRQMNNCSFLLSVSWTLLKVQNRSWSSNWRTLPGISFHSCFLIFPPILLFPLILGWVEQLNQHQSLLKAKFLVIRKKKLLLI